MDIFGWECKVGRGYCDGVRLGEAGVLNGWKEGSQRFYNNFFGIMMRCYYFIWKNLEIIFVEFYIKNLSIVKQYSDEKSEN